MKLIFLIPFIAWPEEELGRVGIGWKTWLHISSAFVRLPETGQPCGIEFNLHPSIRFWECLAATSDAGRCVIPCAAAVIERSARCPAARPA